MVDATDKERQYGELYVLMFDHTRRGDKFVTWKPDIVQLTRGFPGGGIWYAFSLHWRINLGARKSRYIDGPLGELHWPEKCVGRVIGAIPATPASSILLS